MDEKYDLPPNIFSRVRYYDSQFLKDEDFIDEQKYHMDRSRRHERLAHAAGIAEGLDLSVFPDQDGFKLKVAAGTAIDSLGRQILLGSEKIIPLDPSWTSTLWVTIRFEEQEDRPAEANPATGGVGGNTRFTQQPRIEVIADLAAIKEHHPVVLGQIHLAAGVPAITGARTFAGLRLPGPGTASYALQVTEEKGAARPVTVALKGPLDVQDLNVSGTQRNSGLLTVTDKIGIGTTDPKARLHVIGGTSLFGGSVTVGSGGNGSLKVRHINGKHWESDESDPLFLNYNTKQHVHIGNANEHSGLQLYGPMRVYGDRLRNAQNYSIIETNKDDRLRLNPDENYPSVAVHKAVAVGSGGLSVGDWSVQPPGQLHVTGNTLIRGDVGIGTDNPQAKLHVVGGDALFSRHVTVGAGKDGQLKVRDIAGKSHLNDDYDHLFLNWGTKKLVFIGSKDFHSGLELYGPAKIYGDSLKVTGNTLLTGSLGVGTDDPGAKLHVVGHAILESGATASAVTVGRSGNVPYEYDYETVGVAQSNMNLRLQSPNNVIVKAQNLDVHGGTTVKQFPANDTTPSLTRLSLVNRRAGGEEQNWALYTAAVGGGWGVNPNGFEIWEYPATLSRFQIRAGGTTILTPQGGWVGIGTPDPRAKLHVAGDALFSGNITVGAGANGTLKTRHIDGKHWENDNPDNLFLNHNTGTSVFIGNPDRWSGLELYGSMRVYGERLRNAQNYSIVQTNATDWLRINPDSEYPAIALHKPVAIVNGGLAIGEWTHQPPGQLSVTSHAYVGGAIHEGGQRLDDKYAFRDHLRSRENGYSIHIQGDGNFVLYDVAGKPLWASNTGISDATLKRDVTPIPGAMEKLRQIQGVSFFWNEEALGSARELGVLAQEVEDVFPELVNLIDGKHRLVRYEKFVPVLIQALKEQDARIIRLEERLRVPGAMT